eukprot:Skav203919  [mRNA]  locus=scaffold228:373317:396114:- [translate_table: standard]
MTQPDAIFSWQRLFWTYQILAAGQGCLALLFNYLWKEVDSSSSSLVTELQIYIMTGWSYWLLGATYNLTLRQDLPATVQIIVLTCNRMNCALMEFTFTYLLQCRLALLQKGLACDMGVSKVRRIRWVFLLLQLSLDLFRAHVQSQSQLAIDWWSAAYHLVAAIGATWLKQLVRDGSVGERDVSGHPLWEARSELATVFSCILSSASHAIVIPGIILVHGMLRPLLVPAYHFVDSAAELIGLAFIVGILRPQMPGIKPENPSSMRGASQLQGETSSENAIWKAKVEDGCEGKIAPNRELAHRSIDLESLLDFYEKLGSDVMKHFDPQANSVATRPEDKAMVLEKISSVEDFDAELQCLIFGNRGGHPLWEARSELATVFSCILSSASHAIVIPGIILVHGMLRPLLVPAYHFVDSAAELIGLAFIVGILRPQMPGIKPENPSSMRGASQLQGETSSENAIWKAKVEDGCEGKIAPNRELAHRSIDLESLLDFYEKLGSDVMKHFDPQELAHRSIDLESLLDFYEKLGSDVMKHFNPQVSTTADVVRQAVIPLSQVGTGGVAYADYLVMTGKPSRQTPDCMVTHTWSSLFLDLVAAVVSDALELDEYHQIATRIREGKLDNLRQKLASKGALQNRYWICCFCVNQHASICNGVGEAPADPVALARWERNRRDSATGQVVRFCRCSEPKVLNDQPDHCELNKFQVMMLWLHRENPNFRQLVAVDCDFTVFERAWCVAELGAAYDADIPQHICLYSNQPFEFEDEDLSVYTKLTNLSVATDLITREGFIERQKCEGSR